MSEATDVLARIEAEQRQPTAEEAGLLAASFLRERAQFLRVAATHAEAEAAAIGRADFFAMELAAALGREASDEAGEAGRDALTSSIMWIKQLAKARR